MFLYVTAPLTASNTLSENNLKVLVEQPQYQRIELKDFKPLSAQTMYDLGKQSMQRVINGTTIPLKKMYYDPWKVVEYADKYTSNATTVCQEPSSLTITQSGITSSGLTTISCAALIAQISLLKL